MNYKFTIPASSIRKQHYYVWSRHWTNGMDIVSTRNTDTICGPVGNIADHPGPKFTDIVLRFILRYVIGSS